MSTKLLRTAAGDFLICNKTGFGQKKVYNKFESSEEEECQVEAWTVSYAHWSNLDTIHIGINV